MASDHRRQWNDTWKLRRGPMLQKLRRWRWGSMKETPLKEPALLTPSLLTLLLCNCEKLSDCSVHHPLGSYVMAALANLFRHSTHVSDFWRTADLAPVVNDNMSTSTERVHWCGKHPLSFRKVWARLTHWARAREKHIFSHIQAQDCASDCSAVCWDS